MAKWKLSEKAIKEQIARAKEQTRLADEVEPRATAAYFEQGSYRIVVELSNGADFRFSPASVQELEGASPDEIAQVEVSPSGRTLRWKKLDADLSLAGLMAGVFVTRTWMAHLGRIGGQATSEVKAAAARLNGMKGGRPKKPVDVVKAGQKTSHAGAWKTINVSTSPSRKDTKSSHRVSGSSLTQRDKSHGDKPRSTHRTVLRDSKTSRVVGKYRDKGKKK